MKEKCKLPLGYFDFTDVQWAEGSNKRSSGQAKYLEAYIPADRVKDFIDGECVRGDTLFWVERTKHINGQAVRGTAPATCYVAKTVMMHIKCGIQDTTACPHAG